MKVKVLQENLSKGLQIASRFASIKAQLPVLGNVLIRSAKNEMTVFATNLETAIAYKLGAKVEAEGEVTVPAKVIADVIVNLNPGPISLLADKEVLTISTENFKSKVVGMNTGDFPKVVDKVSSGTGLPKDKLKEALSQILFAVGVDESRPVLTGVLFVFGASKLTLVATDGFRLSRKELQIPTKVKLEQVIVPRAILTEIARLDSEDEEIKLEVSKKESTAVFSLGEIVVSSRVINGEFPDYAKIIPTSHSIRVVLEREEFVRGVKLAGVFARDSANVVKLVVTQDKFELTSESANAGNQVVTLDAKIEGLSARSGVEPFAISFNYRFIEEFLGSVNGDEVVLEFTSVDKPGVFLDKADPDYLHLIMPVKT